MRTRSFNVRKGPGIFALIVLLVLQTLPITGMAQQETSVFSLPVASVSTLYHVNIQQVLRENYKQKLQSSSQRANFRWFFHSGVLPPGLRITPDGAVIGRPRNSRAEPYKFKVRVLDSIGGAELVLALELRIEPSRLRLVSTDELTLVPVLGESTPSQNQNARITLGESVAPPWNANRAREQRSARDRSFTSMRAEFTNAGSPSVPSTSSSTVSSAPPADDPSTPSCLPDPTPEAKNDFIINARTGETSGKKKFRLQDNARIIVIEKNPFLYEYKVTLKDKVIVESAIAAFFSGWELFADDLDESKAASPKTSRDAALLSCPQLRQQFQKPFDDIERLRTDLSAALVELREPYTTEEKAYEKVAQMVESDKKVLYNSNASCSSVRDKATSLRTTLQGYKPDLDTLTKAVTKFKRYAELLQDEVEDLAEAVKAEPQPDPNLPAVSGSICNAFLEERKALAAGYVEIANDMDAGLEKIKAGKKAFDTIVKTINNVFSNPYAFFQIYTRGKYGLPTDVEITVERRDLTKTDGAFVKIVDAETINFGGGPRFALAGGVVVSPFETINFKRVPALINGQSATIIGRDESSNSRILPILMLHGRLFEGKGPVSGVHFSLGVTAKPDDSGTNVEFLVGPSISFIEERLFFTFGGYAGRRKQLEGNLVLGQELPEEFTNEIPTSNHLVWKPGFALTFKFK